MSNKVALKAIGIALAAIVGIPTYIFTCEWIAHLLIRDSADAHAFAPFLGLVLGLGAVAGGHYYESSVTKARGIR